MHQNKDDNQLQGCLGVPTSILDLDDDLFPLPVKYYSLKNGIEI